MLPDQAECNSGTKRLIDMGVSVYDMKALCILFSYHCPKFILNHGWHVTHSVWSGHKYNVTCSFITWTNMVTLISKILSNPKCQNYRLSNHRPKFRDWLFFAFQIWAIILKITFSNSNCQNHIFPMMYHLPPLTNLLALENQTLS